MIVVSILKFNSLSLYNYDNMLLKTNEKNNLFFSKKILKIKFIKKKLYKKLKKKIFFLMLIRLKLLLSLRFFKIFLLKLLILQKLFKKSFKYYSRLIFIKYFGFKFKKFFKLQLRKKKIYKKGNFFLTRQFTKYQKHMLKKYIRFAYNKRNLSRQFICYLKPYKFYRTLRFKKRKLKRRIRFRMIFGSRRFCREVLKQMPKYGILD